MTSGQQRRKQGSEKKEVKGENKELLQSPTTKYSLNVPGT